MLGKVCCVTKVLVVKNFVLDLQFSYLEQRLSACRDVKN